MATELEEAHAAELERRREKAAYTLRMWGTVATPERVALLQSTIDTLRSLLTALVEDEPSSNPEEFSCAYCCADSYEHHQSGCPWRQAREYLGLPPERY